MLILCGRPQSESDSQAFGRRFFPERLCHDFIHHFDLTVVQAHCILWHNAPSPCPFDRLRAGSLPRWDEGFVRLYDAGYNYLYLTLPFLTLRQVLRSAQDKLRVGTGACPYKNCPPHPSSLPQGAREKSAMRWRRYNCTDKDAGASIKACP